MNLEGRTAFVTGGGTGIGLAAVRALSDAGATVVLAARRPEPIDFAAAELRRKGRKAFAIPCDVTDPASVKAAAERAAREAGPVDIVVNNAGVATASPFRSLTLEEWERHLKVNATGTMLVSQAFLPGMAERKWGRIVMIASVAGRTGAPYIAAYAASKHAVLGIVRSLAAEYADKAITVNAVCPGFVDTDLTSASVDRIVEKTGRNRDQAIEAIISQSPQRRLMTPDEVGFVVSFLCDERARGINGQAIVVDGGALLA